LGISLEIILDGCEERANEERLEETGEGRGGGENIGRSPQHTSKTE